MTRAVFLDRDGVINRVVFQSGLPSSPRSVEEFEILPQAPEAVRTLREDLGFIAIIVTNQPDVARGRLTRDELDRMHDLLRSSVEVDDIYVCPHDDSDSCGCRKPRAGMLEEAAAKWGIDLGRSFMVGDSWKDIEAGKEAGCRTFLIQTPYNSGVAADFVANDLCEAVQAIAKLKQGGRP